MDGTKLKIIQISDTHITRYKNLLLPITTQIEKENADLVVMTGDLIDSNNDEFLFKTLEQFIKIQKIPTIIVPGDYDSGDLWTKYFGEQLKISYHFADYTINAVDTSFMGHKYATGWGDHLLDPRFTEQANALKKDFSDGRKHLIFSHHPFWILPREKHHPSLKFVNANVRGTFSGHYHKAFTYFYNYKHPLHSFDGGFVSVPHAFHGESTYVVLSILDTEEMVARPMSTADNMLNKWRG